jgi:nucleoside phosphorylase
MTRPRLPPRRFDFVVFTATPLEKDAAVAELGLKHAGFEGDRQYYWGYVRSLSVAIVCAGESGYPAATDATNWIVEVLSPDYLLIVGHGGGISKNVEGGVKSGIVLVSTGVVRCLTIRTIGNSKEPNGGSLDSSSQVPRVATAVIGNANRTPTSAFPPSPAKETQVIPPSRRLMQFARDLAACEPWTGKVLADEQEILTANELAGDRTDKTFKEIVDQYPRAVMWDMEAGAVADTLTRKRERFDRVPAYLVIKGFSDVHEMEEPESDADAKKNAEQRERERKAASENAARFVKAFIEKSGSALSRRPSPLQRLIRPGARIAVNDSIAGVLHAVDPACYSSIASFNFERCLGESGKSKKIFTVCAFEPDELWDVIAESRADERRPKEDIAELRNRAARLFPHFETFSNHAKEDRSSCTRILLLKDDRWQKRLKPEHWELFWKLNGYVNCFGVVRSNLPDVPFLTDYCVIGDSLVLDYYDDSQTLLLSDVSQRSDLRHVLLKLRDVFQSDPKRFITSNQLRKQSKSAASANIQSSVLSV